MARNNPGLPWGGICWNTVYIQTIFTSPWTESLLINDIFIWEQYNCYDFNFLYNWRASWWYTVTKNFCCRWITLIIDGGQVWSDGDGRSGKFQARPHTTPWGPTNITLVISRFWLLLHTLALSTASPPIFFLCPSWATILTDKPTSYFLIHTHIHTDLQKYIQSLMVHTHTHTLILIF